MTRAAAATYKQQEQFLYISQQDKLWSRSAAEGHLSPCAQTGWHQHRLEQTHSAVTPLDLTASGTLFFEFPP